jgi:hypothetical protein
MNLFQRYVNARTDKNFEKSVLTHKKGRVSLTDVVSECERKALIFRHFSAFKRVFSKFLSASVTRKGNWLIYHPQID